MDSRIHPELRPYLTGPIREGFSRDTIATMRGGMPPFAAANLPAGTVDVTERIIPGYPPAGAPEIRVRVYDFHGKKQDRPGVLYLHGGGYILGTPEMTDGCCSRMAAELGGFVASVDYRLAPEHPYPAGLEDCYAALVWLSGSAGELGVDRDRIAVVGGSAGGGLTAALTLLARDRKGPAIAFQVPLYPMLDDRNITPSSHEITDPRFWNRDKNLAAWDMYLGPLSGGDVPATAAPARADDLSGLPPAFTMVGELDMFRDEAIDYVARLLRAGVPTEFHIYPGCYHGFDMFPCGVGRQAEGELFAVLKRALGK